MATLKQIRDSIAAKSKDKNFTAVSSALVDQEINRAVGYYKTHRFWFNESVSVTNLVTSQKEIPNIPSDILTLLQEDGLTIKDGQIKVNLRKITPEQYDEMDEEQTGRPEYFTYRNSEYLILPYPSETYQATIRYLKDYDDLVNDSDTNDFTTNARYLIEMRALSTIYTEFKEDPELATFYEGREKQEYDTLELRTNNLLASGSLEVCTII